MSGSFEKGLAEVGPGLWAWLQPSGTWGRSNAGLISDAGESLLIDTLFDVKLTREMLDAMGPIVGDAPIGTVLLTHGDGDHWWGTELLPDARIYATSAAIDEMRETPPAVAAGMLAAELPPALRAFVDMAFGPYDFDGISPRVADEAVDAPRSFRVGSIEAEFVPIGPAHTGGDAIVHVREHGVVYAGDVLFVDNTPITWSGPVASWIAACDRLLALDADVYVPGHGPLTDADGVRAVREYFAFVLEESRARMDRGMTAQEAAFDIDLGPYADVIDADRIVVSVDRAYADLDPSYTARDRVEMFAVMAAYRARA
jgi:glyoxylase-like metal-dependent hydrolase (beta-lactamase superfamily II)